MFRHFQSSAEEARTVALLSSIDQGEARIFQEAGASSDGGGFIDRLYYSDGSAWGTFTSSRFKDTLHLQAAFHPDLPEKARSPLKRLIEEARRTCPASASLWYPPQNSALEDLILTELPWEAKIEKIRQLTFLANSPAPRLILPVSIRIVPFAGKYAASACRLLDEALSPWFDVPGETVFCSDRKRFAAQWLEKARTGECQVLLADGEVAGIYLLNGAEIDLLAVAGRRQGQGLGRLLLHHAREHIASARQTQPFLYCLDRNAPALGFYQHEGMAVTAHAACAQFHPLTPRP